MTVTRTPDEIFVFNHLMKCGGVSFSIYLANQIKPDRTELLNFPGKMDEFRKNLAAGFYRKPSRLYLYSHFAGSLRELFPGRNLHQITLLREPWARFKSAYQFSQEISYFPEMSIEQWFRGCWHNPITLSLGDGNLGAAKERLEREHTFFGLTEEYEKSIQMLAQLFGFEQTTFVHANKSARREQRPVPEWMGERFHELNRDDLELYRFARELFERRWQELEPGLREQELPAAQGGDNKAKTIKKLIESFRTERQPDDSFLFAPYRRDDRAQQILWGIFYRLIPATHLYELLGQSRWEQVRQLLDNLEAYHRDCPFAHPLVPEVIAYFRALTPGRLEALVGKLLATLKVDTSRAQEKRLGQQMPYGLLNYLGFVDTKTMLKLFSAMKGEIDIEAEVERLMED